jgi:hypothetical protein
MTPDSTIVISTDDDAAIALLDLLARLADEALADASADSAA